MTSSFALGGLASAPMFAGCARTDQETPPSESRQEQSHDWIRLGEIPDLDLHPRPPTTEEEAQEIRAFIAELASVDAPDFGLSPTLTGQTFAPLPGQSQADALLMVPDHALRTAEPLQRLVELGPKALPYLLAALEDETPTRLTIVPHHPHFGGMHSGGELWRSPVNPFETAVRDPWPAGETSFRDWLTSYTVKIGDVAFVAIGQILGRPYQAVRYQPTMITIINSPVEDARLREALRAAWSSPDPFRRVFHSLLADYSTEGVFNGVSLDDWGVASDLQISAALRLLYYFPNETGAFIARRLDSLDVLRASSHRQSEPSTHEELRTWMLREVRNGVRTVDFIKAVSWCSEPAVHEALRAISRRSDDPDILEALPEFRD